MIPVTGGAGFIGGNFVLEWCAAHDEFVATNVVGTFTLLDAARAHWSALPGHDRRYAIDAAKIRHDLGWTPRETFETGLRRTVRWYLDHGDWLDAVTRGVDIAAIPTPDTAARPLAAGGDTKELLCAES